MIGADHSGPSCRRIYVLPQADEVPDSACTPPLSREASPLQASTLASPHDTIYYPPPSPKQPTASPTVEAAAAVEVVEELAYVAPKAATEDKPEEEKKEEEEEAEGEAAAAEQGKEEEDEGWILSPPNSETPPRCRGSGGLRLSERAGERTMSGCILYRRRLATSSYRSAMSLRSGPGALSLAIRDPAPVAWRLDMIFQDADMGHFFETADPNLDTNIM